MVVAMIESQAGLDAVDAIASVDGVDVVLVGANDLSVALGVAGHMDSPQVHDAYVRVIEACRAKGRRWGSADWAGAQTSSVATWSSAPATSPPATTSPSSALRPRRSVSSSTDGHSTPQETPMKICVYGAGAVGGHIAGG